MHRIRDRSVGLGSGLWMEIYPTHPPMKPLRLAGTSGEARFRICSQLTGPFKSKEKSLGVAWHAAPPGTRELPVSANFPDETALWRVSVKAQDPLTLARARYILLGSRAVGCGGDQPAQVPPSAREKSTSLAIFR